MQSKELHCPWSSVTMNSLAAATRSMLLSSPLCTVQLVNCISLSIMRCVVTHDPNEFAKQLFKAGQQPAAWLRSAGRLRDAAEVILKHELPAEISYSQALKTADEEAVAVSVRDGTDAGVADIKAIAPNYPPAQLLYAYAIENVLKGLIVFKRPGLIQEHELHRELKSHDLNELAKKAKVTVEQHERPVLEALTHLSI